MNLSAETGEKAMFDNIASMLRIFEEKTENLMPVLEEIQEKYQYFAPALWRWLPNISSCAPGMSMGWLPFTTVVNDTVCGHMAPSKVEGLILGFDIEKERKEREKQDSESKK